MPMYVKYGKRPLDLIIGMVALVLLSPVLLLIATLVRLDLGAPVLFRQARSGLHGRSFVAIKFRSMREARDGAGNPLPDDSDEAYAAARSGSRMTPFGRFLRESSLDELGGLLNVIGGDMSIVGPRPLVTRYLDRYTPDQMRRHEVRPGITGLAQISGRQDIPFEERFVLDLWYVEHVSLWLDLSILLRTPLAVLRRRGASETGYATGREFTGTAADRDD